MIKRLLAIAAAALFCMGSCIVQAGQLGDDEAREQMTYLKEGRKAGIKKGRNDAQLGKPKQVPAAQETIDTDVRSYDEAYRQGYEEGYNGSVRKNVKVSKSEKSWKNAGDAAAKGKSVGNKEGKVAGEAQGIADAKLLGRNGVKPTYQSPMYKRAPLDPQDPNYLDYVYEDAKSKAYWDAYVKAAKSAYDKQIKRDSKTK